MLPRTRPKKSAMIDRDDPLRVELREIRDTVNTTAALVWWAWAAAIVYVLYRLVRWFTS